MGHSAETIDKTNEALAYVVRINSEDYPAALYVCKIYLTLPDTNATTYSLFRVINESGK